MNVELDRTDLESLIRGAVPSYDVFNNPLLIKAGHRYSDQYGRTSWNSLDQLTDKDLMQLYMICKNN